MPDLDPDFEIDTFAYMGSAIGNAFFSGMTFQQLWECTHLSTCREEFDEAVTATIRLNEIVGSTGQHT